MTTNPIAAARALIAAQPDLLFRCDLCPDECNCHPHHDMSMSGEYILCDGCEDFDNPKGVPDPLTLIATLADALEAERAKVAAAYEVGQLRMRERCADMVEREGHGLHVAIRYAPLTPADAEAALDKLLTEARLEGWRAGRDAAADQLTSLAAVLRKSENSYHQSQASALLERADSIRALPEPKEAYHNTTKGSWWLVRKANGKIAAYLTRRDAELAIAAAAVGSDTWSEIGALAADEEEGEGLWPSVMR